MSDEHYLARCRKLASRGDSRVGVNPRVGAVIVHKDRIIGEGYHAYRGGPHAEVMAVRSVRAQALLPFSRIYVSLEPCNFTGKTPPCTELILKHKIPEVIIGCADPHPKVAGKGAERLQQNGVSVRFAEDPTPFIELIRPFYVNQQEKRPYITLKWAQSADRFLAGLAQDGSPQPTPISGTEAARLTHQLRAHHYGIMVGRSTAEIDNPTLTTRLFPGPSPVRIIWDRQERLPVTLKVFQDGGQTWVLGKGTHRTQKAVTWLPVLPGAPLHEVLAYLYQEGVGSLLVEGGTFTHKQFLEQGLFDEIYIYQAPKELAKGVPAPSISTTGNGWSFQSIGNDLLMHFKRKIYEST
ncbi:MAG: bifunctional diaminohydroxyphosphoribosylaminopyrimidine deaminase/5-amino-6-(5-phosphoribosylamino)uracil reductase RibD [Bacteroidota bacterium]